MNARDESRNYDMIYPRRIEIHYIDVCIRDVLANVHYMLPHIHLNAGWTSVLPEKY